MTRTIERTYTFSQREVREAILAALKAKDIPCPQYVGNTDTCTWRDLEDGSVVVAWTDTGEIELS